MCTSVLRQHPDLQVEHWPGLGSSSSASPSKHPPGANPLGESLLSQPCEMEGRQSINSSEKIKAAAQRLLSSSCLVRSHFCISGVESNWDLTHQSIWLTIKTACQLLEKKKPPQVSRTAGGKSGEMVFHSLALYGVSYEKSLYFPPVKYRKENTQETNNIFF